MLRKAAGGAGGGISGVDSQDSIYSGYDGIDPNGPAKEYKAVGLLVGEFMWTFRISMGDFSAIGATKSLSVGESQIFWVIWFITALMTCIIFLNFVVAEAMGSYEKVKAYLEPVI